MAQKVNIVLIDDIDGSEAIETVSFGLDGTSYEIDLSTKNAEAQNYDFQKKKDTYFSGKNGVAVFALTSQVLSQPTWTPEVVVQRQSQLTKVLYDLWELN